MSFSAPAVLLDFAGSAGDVSHGQTTTDAGPDASADADEYYPAPAGEDDGPPDENASEVPPPTDMPESVPEHA